ncbi:MAG TPA: VWA domain-containing protein [Novosphingobium sp.]
MNLSDAELVDRWRANWPAALAHWSKYTRLRDPQLCTSSLDAAREGLSGSFAMIRLADKSVVIDLPQVRRYGLEDYGVEVLAHEIGHHVLAPATPADHFRLIARIRKALPTLENHAPMAANLFTDLLINDRLQHQEGLRMDAIYRRMAEARPKDEKVGALWQFYTGIYEQLWSLERGVLGGPTEDARLLGDAWLGARVLRVYARDWLIGASRFAVLLLPYLVEDAEALRAAAALFDTREAGHGSEPAGVSDVEAGEAEVLHPSEDGAITGRGEDAVAPTPAQGKTSSGSAQRREPFEYGEILRAAGVTLSDQQVAARYYREQALPHLVRFPARMQSRSAEPQIEGVEAWDIGDPLDEIDWLSSLSQSPIPVPGVTTVRRLYGEESGQAERVDPVDLDLYVDSSGSMPNPQHQVSYLALAGAIIALSALRAGSRVQATLWSSKDQVMCTSGFVRNEDEILAVLTGYFGGGTAFPIHKLRDTYADRPETERAVHILQISDDGISTMFDSDERGNRGWDVSAMALRTARGGGTMALNLWSGGHFPWKEPAEAQGWMVETVTDFEQLIAFARAFARRNYDPSLAQVAV